MTRDTYGITELVSDFPREEYVARCEKACSLMDEQNIDGLLLGKEENIAYLSGYRRMIKYQFTYMMLPKDGPPVLVVPLDQRGNAENMSWIEDIRFFGPSSLGFSDATETGLKALKELGFADKVIGVEESPQVPQQKTWDTIKRHLKETREVDELIWKLRMVKSPLELRYIRRACDITCKAFIKALEEVREGMTERGFARIVYRTMIDEGAEDTPLKGLLNLHGGPSRYAMPDTRPTDYKFRRGDIVVLDGGITYKGYWCDITRLTCIGQPSKRQREMFEACLEAVAVGVEALQPGKKISEVCGEVERVIEKHGMAKNKYLGSTWFGHNLGLEIHERPDIHPVAPDSNIVLEPGMVLAIEAWLVDDPVTESMLKGYKPGGEGIFGVEDNVLITEKGPENLTPIPRELNIV